MADTLRQGSPAKRAAIARAALDVFVREGYARASVDAIAVAAGVSKRTIYDYYGDKERLFLSAIRETMAAQEAAFHELLDRTLGEVTDLEAALTAFGRAFASEMARSAERAAVMRLMIAEAAHFPDLVRAAPEDRPVQRALADRLAELTEQGLLDAPDPLEAAEFLGLLLTGRVNHRSWYGAAPLDDTEIDRLVAGGVWVFLRAYGR
ncbi:TetR family transcriptional regulator [Frankia canadensis]|uniref:TetR family transcriptional regulator n=1 Tax=Frankia canadensis TaxID=1836972 RepID=A0A2I2KLS3_9ACTN|nr:TetR/AcrR family transcriptional regulator [Frankia canadensis]SNQ46614.1 TetR family transcriptional regulator [Frankia canadensis]SOU53904.1 TetR family transcriptional regulator [Frankia canadensis]